MENRNERNANKRRWEPMKLTPVGHVRDVIRFGGGKLTAIGGDTGDPRKALWCG
jgi:hypothetical protein